MIDKEKKIPFEIAEYSEPNKTTYAAMENVENDTDVYGPFDNISDLMEALNA